uniref:Acyl-CoA oxidase C-terminal domain-containing protein n=1 Tax=Timema poppense TaxID=170557 RepID=A0A7R9H8W3_TIMPO|nr:unnamed protein product [Timema poppensis]
MEEAWKLLFLLELEATLTIVCVFTVILSTYQWLLCWLLRETDRRLKQAEQEGKNRFTARNHAQVFRARTLSIAYAEHNL